MIPNNVGLNGNPHLFRQLKAYQAKFRTWWDACGPLEYRNVPIFLRCPTGLDSKNWAEFKYVRPDEYQWGIFITRNNQDTISFGAFKGQPVWSSVPSEYKTFLLDHIRMQADAEPGSVEQSRSLTLSAPSLYDLRNLYQFLLEEARHLWAMTHILLEHFGHDGMVETEALLERTCGDDSNPRLLDAFNFRTDDWLSHFIWCFLADRDGKYQLDAVSDSSFAPLAASAGFILQEEHFHLAIGVAGLERVLRRSAEVTLKEQTEDIFKFGAIPIPVVQRYINFWASKVYDLFGNDESTRAFEMYQIGVRAPRYLLADQHAFIEIDRRSEKDISSVHVKAESAINAVMRRRYIKEVSTILGRFNEILAGYHIDTKITMPHERFNRRIGPCKGLAFDTDGTLLQDSEADARISLRLPTLSETLQVKELMQAVTAPDKVASWLAPPKFLVDRREPALGFQYLLM